MHNISNMTADTRMRICHEPPMDAKVPPKEAHVSLKEAHVSHKEAPELPNDAYVSLKEARLPHNEAHRNFGFICSLQAW